MNKSSGTSILNSSQTFKMVLQTRNSLRQLAQFDNSGYNVTTKIEKQISRSSLKQEQSYNEDDESSLNQQQFVDEEPKTINNKQHEEASTHDIDEETKKLLLELNSMQSVISSAIVSKVSSFISNSPDRINRVPRNGAAHRNKPKLQYTLGTRHLDKSADSLEYKQNAQLTASIKSKPSLISTTSHNNMQLNQLVNSLQTPLNSSNASSTTLSTSTNIFTKSSTLFRTPIFHFRRPSKPYN
jgi:hypothetical protein